MDIYTDGNNLNNGSKDSIGGNGYVIIKNNQLIHYSIEVNKNTTNNIEELKGAINSLIYLKDKNEYFHTIYSDSQYVVNGAEVWSKNWIKNNWKKGKNSSYEIKNIELWKQLLYLKEITNTTFTWIRRDSSKWNTLVDSLINKEINKHTMVY